jgi:hypothetical protein
MPDCHPAIAAIFARLMDMIRALIAALAAGGVDSQAAAPARHPRPVRPGAGKPVRRRTSLFTFPRWNLRALARPATARATDPDAPPIRPASHAAAASPAARTQRPLPADARFIQATTGIPPPRRKSRALAAHCVTPILLRFRNN